MRISVLVSVTILLAFLVKTVTIEAFHLGKGNTNYDIHIRIDTNCNPEEFQDCFPANPADCKKDNDCKKRWLGTYGYEKKQCTPPVFRLLGTNCHWWCSISYMYLPQLPSVCKNSNGGVLAG
ncbi:unnamed protein product [Owenia fusiformis]|uniref:Uncharacterized protein n=1 Tax=Owenia fusiformis TaxID=6347 RepID=A0A8S4N0R4_OWEFU|nr:unnamed protein product [Owenia fusiformis]